MNKETDIISCESCGYSGNKKDMIKSCGNCFACTGCEIYVCPGCSGQIVIKPVDNTRSFRKLRSG